ncbi:MAG: TetR/AcrR family transcriptional regulator [Planctomycetes bacterium]|nr:TetR/AcrR family transcriptional regulator [Planctomycetota bacterium]NOG55357.1 TetR/AcrR family transcriptional regulator [Planctomycetota bacterium]
MRVTAQKKAETRERIVAEALQLFEKKGFADTTTRDIARAAGIATGTMFNYFDSKEALAMTVFADVLKTAGTEVQQRLTGCESIAEALFAFITTGLRHLDPHRRYVGEVYENTMTPFAIPGACAEADAVRQTHLETVWQLVVARAGQCTRALDDFEILTSHLYWSLYLAVVAFWSRDDSPNQEDTLAMLDRTTRLFAQSLNVEDTDYPPNQQDAELSTPEME